MDYKDYAKEMADKVIKMIDSNTSAWRRTFDVQGPQNYVTGKPYNNSNHLSLSLEASMRGFADPRWMTQKQAAELGGSVTGKPAVVAFWSDTQNVEVVNPDTKEKERQTVKLDRPVFRTYAVWNVEQCEGIENLKPLEPRNREGDMEIDEAIQHIKDLTKLEFAPGRPAYSPGADRITMPPVESFHTPNDYYETMLHEVTHWTGAKHREGRKLENPFGTVAYAREEMVAEIGALVTAGRTGITIDDKNAAAYMDSWWKAAKQLLQEKPHELVSICRDAYSASDFILEGKELERLQTLAVAHKVELTPEEKAAGRIELSIPYSEKNDAKALAAGLGVDLKWDKDAKTWFAEVEDGQNIGSLAKYRTDKMNAPENESEGQQPLGTRQQFDIPFALKDAAKTEAAKDGIDLKWDRASKSWGATVPEGKDISNFTTWLAAQSERPAPKEREAAPAMKSEVTGPQPGTHQKFDIPFTLKEVAKVEASKSGIELKWDKASKSWGAAVPEGKDISNFTAWLNAQNGKQVPTDREAAPAMKNDDRIEADQRQRMYLNIPFADKDTVKAEAQKENVPLKFDSDLKAWYTYKDALTPYFEKLVPQGRVSEVSANAPSTFAEALHAMGAKDPAQMPIFDGRFHRLKDVNDSDGSSISYKAYNNGVANATIINHRSGEKMQWIDKGRELSKEDYAELKLANANRLEENRIETAKRFAAAAESTKAELSAAMPADPKHPYLARKGVQAHDLKQDKDGNILIALTNVHGEIRSIQRIDPEGTKSYAKGGSKSGHFHALGKIAGATTVLICEGYATAATLHEVSGLPVVAAMDANNLLAVCENLRKHLPEASLVVAADNDRFPKPNKLGPPNPGKHFAEQAAAAVKAEVCIAEFKEGEKGTDFNDLGKLSKARVHENLRGVLTAIKAKDVRREVEAKEAEEPAKAKQVAKAKSKVNER